VSFRYSISGGPAGVAAAQAALADYLAGQGAPSRVVHRAELVLEEVALNALRHGGAPDVLLEADMQGDVCILVLEDAGIAFDPVAAIPPAPAASLAEAKIGGLGLVLVHRTARALRYTRTPAGRNRLEVELPTG
jgi:anti-sigma regulatory factor (Ser/Thr protein kinase)